MRRTIGLLVSVTIFAACSSGSGAPPDPVTGVVVDITEGEGFGAVESFELRSEGETYEILIDQSKEYGFPLGHLNDHLQGADPVRVDIEEKDGAIYAVTIEDA